MSRWTWQICKPSYALTRLTGQWANPDHSTGRDNRVTTNGQRAKPGLSDPPSLARRASVRRSAEREGGNEIPGKPRRASRISLPLNPRYAR